MSFGIHLMRMVKMFALALVASFSVWSAPALANRCGLETASGGVASLVYDPFKGSATTISVTNLVLRRVNGAGGEKTMAIDFYLKPQTAAGNGIQATVTSATGAGSAAGIGNQIMFPTTGPFPTPSTATSNVAPPGTIYWNFGGNDPNSDTVTLGLTITIPGNLNIPATTTIAFDIVYACDGTGRGGAFSETGIFPGAMQAQITVLSALQASTVGTSLDFGEIGALTPAQAIAWTTIGTTYIRVQSSGAYQFAIASQNAFRLKHPSGTLGNPSENVNYKLWVFGEKYDIASNPVPGSIAVNKTCMRAGVGSNAEDNIYLTGVLQESGAGKTPSLSGVYSDTLTVTVTPQDIPVIGTTDCKTLGQLRTGP